MSTHGQTSRRAGRSLRITRKSDFDRLFEQGLRASDSALTLLAAARPEAGAPSRVGVAIATRCGSAVRRNRIKRLCREAFRLLRAELPAGRDYMIVPRPGAELSLRRVQGSLRTLAARVERQIAPASPAGGKQGGRGP